MKRNIYLYGELAEKYGKVHSFFVHSIAETIRALKANFPDFYQTIKNGKFHILRGSDLKSCEEITEEELTILFPKEDFHIMPVIEGGKSGWVNVVIGAVLVVVGALTSWSGIGSYMITIGIGMMLGGVVSLLTPIPKTPSYGTRENPDQRPSFVFNGATNRIEQGGPIPLVFGEMITGSIVISGAIDVEQMI